MGLLISDGFVMEDTIAARGRIPALTFRYRPALPEQVYEYQRANQGVSGKQQVKVISDFLLAHLVSWDVCEKEGETVPISADTLRRVPALILLQIVNIVAGYASGEGDAKN